MDKVERLWGIDREWENVPIPWVNTDYPVKQQERADRDKEWDDVFASLTSIERDRYFRVE